MVSYGMAFTTLIIPAVLAMHLDDDDPSYVIVDCRFKLDDVEWGRREYAAAHIRGAVYADLNHDLSGPRSGTNGRHPLPDAHALAHTFSRLGIASGVQVVAYDQSNGMFASRLWWMLRWLGHDAAAVLDGGLAKWVAEGRPTAAGAEPPQAREFRGVPRAAMAVSADEVAAHIGTSECRLVDARAPERYRGETEPIDKTPGHIPGAANHFYQWNVDEHGLFHTPEQLRARLQESLGDARPDQVVCYCGSGVTACHNLLALEHAGMKGAKLYPGSWSEWSSDAARPVEHGEPRKIG